MTDRRRIVLLVCVATALHVAVAWTTGLGDAEALYAAHSRHLQAGYVDHPPAIGFLIAAGRLLGGETPFGVRLPSVLLFAAAVVLVVTIVRRLGGSPRAEWLAAATYVLVPELWASGVAASPDAPLAVAWLLALWALLRSEAAAAPRRRLAWALLAGAAAGAALLSKYSGAWLLAGVAVWGCSRGRAMRAALVLVVASACFLPVLLWNADHGWVSALHRLVWTQEGAGPSLRNAGALVGGQLAYVSPIALLGLGWAALGGTTRDSDQGIRLLRGSSIVALGIGYALCLLSRVAEPHWPAPGYLGLVPVLGVLADRAWSARKRRLWRFGVGWSVAVIVVLHLAVWTPLLVVSVPVHVYDGRTDLTNDLRGWSQVADAVRRIAPPDLPVAAFHYTTCSQIAFALREDGDRVRCLTEEVDDYDLWGRGGLRPGSLAIVVDDPRFDRPPGRVVRRIEVPIQRGGRTVRLFGVALSLLETPTRSRDGPPG